jgi:predicted Zn-dependent protease with MMP-like domain
MIDVPRAAFEHLVSEALDSLPPELAGLMDNVAIFVEDDPPPGQSLFGLYEGVPLTSRSSSSYMMAMPDRITIFRRPTLAACWTVDQVRDQVRITVAHEIAHHFGIGDERLHDLGYG